MSFNALVFLALFVFVVCACVLGLRRYKSSSALVWSSSREAPPPIPPSDLEFRLGGDDPYLVLGYTNASGIFTIWTLSNDVFSGYAGQFYVSSYPERRSHTTKDFNEVVTIRGTTTTGVQVTGTGQGPLRMGNTYVEETGNLMLGVGALVIRREPAFAGDVLAFGGASRVKTLVPGTIEEKPEGTWWRMVFPLGSDKELRHQASMFISKVNRESQIFVRKTKSAEAWSKGYGNL